MRQVCFYFQVHQPHRLRRFRVFDIGRGRTYFDDAANREIVGRVAAKCYLPANRTLLELIRRSNGRFRVAMSLSGTLLDQLETDAPEALASFQELVATGAVELLGETYYHSLAGLADEREFAEQVRLHRAALQRHFGVRATVFRNTELIFSDAVAPLVARLGFRGALVEGAPGVLGWRSPDHVYHADAAPDLRLLPRNFRLSDDVAFRFSNRSWSKWPLTAETYAQWVAAGDGASAHIFMDYETFGEHQWEETGIFEFLRHLPRALALHGVEPVTPSDLVAQSSVGGLRFPHPVSWADESRDVSAWLGNALQRAAHERLYRLGPAIRSCHDHELLERWRRLTTSDHCYYMATKEYGDGEVHQYFSHFDTPYDAYIAFMNAVQDLEQVVTADRALAWEAGIDNQLVGVSAR